MNAQNITSCSAEKYSLEELRFLCQKYNRLHQDVKLFELGKIRFNRELVHSNMSEEEGVLYQNLFQLSTELTQRKQSLINEQKLKNIIFSPNGLNCDYTQQLIVQNSEFNEVKVDAAKDKKKQI